MRFKTFATATLLTAGLTGSLHAATAAPPTCDGGQTVSAEEALQKFKGNIPAMRAKTAASDLPTVMIDPRTTADYQRAHIPGAINLPVEEGVLTKESLWQVTGAGAKDMLLYCNGENCPRSHMACDAATSFGYHGKIYYFYTGMGPNGWPRLNGPTVAGEKPYPDAP